MSVFVVEGNSAVACGLVQVSLTDMSVFSVKDILSFLQLPSSGNVKTSSVSFLRNALSHPSGASAGGM